MCQISAISVNVFVISVNVLNLCILGIQVVSSTQLAIVGPEDCKLAMVDAVKRMSTSKASKNGGLRKDSTAMATEFEKELELGLNGAEEEKRFPEPEVMLTVGRVLTTAGFLPWHIRLTEIL